MRYRNCLMKTEGNSDYFNNIIITNYIELNMQSADLENKTQQYVRKHPFIKALILSELEDDVEIYKYIA